MYHYCTGLLENIASDFITANSFPYLHYRQMEQLITKIIEGLRHTTLLEYIAVISGIASVWYSKKENILVYPVGLVNTIIYIYISVDASLFGEACVNLYYTIISFYGWVIWAKKDESKQYRLHITNSTAKEWLQHLSFFALLYIGIYTALTYINTAFYANAIPWADGFASATAFTGMWLMAKKKVESWWWWIATNIASIPLYFIKGYVITAVYYFVLLILAVAGLQEWSRKTQAPPNPKIIV
jgi:nicotinamide mononucleotide transporter